MSYIYMFIAQRYGAEIIELLHGHESMLKATAPQYEDVRPDAPLEELCEGYDNHHFNAVSNCSHAAGMILVFITLISFLHKPRLEFLCSLPPIWYLYAWVGHFFLQKDIPAVFVYGMTFRGWLSGEYCSILSLFGGRTISEPWEFALTLVMVIMHLYSLPPLPGWGWAGTDSRGALYKKNK
jgi:hypothetical protein